MEGYIHGDKGTRGSLGKVRKMLLGCLTPAFAVCLAVGLFLYFPISSGVQTYAADSSFNNIVNTNIGLHPKWVMDTCTTVAKGGVGDNYTNAHKVWHTNATADNDVIMERSPSYVFSGEEENATKLASEYSLKKGNDVVFNITDSDTAAKVWADAVAFAQTLGPATAIADPTLAGTSPSTACKGGATKPAQGYSQENHNGFRVGTNTGVRNMYKGNYFINNADGALGQYITVRLHTDWVAKAISVAGPSGTSTISSTDYVNVTGNGATIQSTTFNYILTDKQAANDNYLLTTNNYNRTQSVGEYKLSYDISSNSVNYDFNSAPVFNDNCAFSFGRIQVPTGVYIVLDLNGHTIDRALTGIGKGAGTTNNGDMFGSVFHINSEARLEICDTSAYENASSLRIERYQKVAANSSPDAVALPGYGDQKIWKPIASNDLTTHCDLVITNHKGMITGGYNSGTGDREGAYGAGVLLKNDSTKKLIPEMQQRGGAVNLSMWADLVVHSGTIFGNQTPNESGGAFYQRSKAAVTIFDGYVIGNSASGGGVSVLGGQSGCAFVMYGGVLAYNNAKGQGGAVSFGYSSYGNFHGGEIVNNTAGTNGGAIFLNGNTLGILDSVTITGNTAGTNGGGVYVSEKVAAVDSLFREENKLGPAFKFRGSLQIYNNTVSNKANNVYLAYGTTATNGVDGLTLSKSYTGFPKIAIGGSLFKNGIVARVGVTLGSYSTSSNVFTSGYAADHGTESGNNNGVNTYVYFFADDTGRAVINNGSGATMEATLGSSGSVGSGSTLTWVIKGKGIYQGTEENITIAASDNTTRLYKERNGGISYTYEGLTCEFRMLSVTSVAAYTSYSEAQPTTGRVAYWEITESGGSYTITSTFTRSQFRFKLGENDLDMGAATLTAATAADNPVYKAIVATDHSLSYAGEYSFLVANGTTRYTNPNFKIRINQVGVEVDRQLYYNGADVTSLGWQKDINWDNNKTVDGVDIIDERTEKDQPYFIYTGGYYYPILSADYNNEEVQILSLHNPFDGKTYNVSKREFTGYVLDFTYANTAYFGTSDKNKFPDGSPKGVDVDFGAHSGGGIEYRTMHRQPGQVTGVGTFVPGVMHAGTYSVSFVSSRSAESADASNDDYIKTGVYFAANNFAFSSAVNIYVAPAGAEVQLTDKARDNFVYQGLAYTDREIVEFDNTSDTSVNPHTDDAASMVYYLFDKLSYKAGIYDIRTGFYYTLDQIKDWDNNRPWGSDEEVDKGLITDKRPKLTDYTHNQIKERPVVTYDAGDAFDYGDSRFQGILGGENLTAFEAEYIKTRKPDSTGRLCYIIDAESFTGEFCGQPTDARRYVVLVTLDLDVGYDDYDYEFDQDAEHLVGIDGKSDYFWAFEFTIDPAEINPYEALGAGGAPDGANTSVTLNKEHIFNNAEMKPNDERLGLSVSYGSTVLAQEDDYTVELASDKDYTNASVASDDKTKYNLPLIIKFGGSNKNYVNEDSTNAVKDTLDGSDAHEYGAEGNYAFVVYFRIIPVEVTVTGSLSYTYDGSSFERARYLEPSAPPHNYDWYESIFFLVQDNNTISSELINHQHDDHYPAGTSGNDDKLNDLWGGDDVKDIPRYKSRFTLSLPTVAYSSEDFKANSFELGIGLYSFKTESVDKGSYHLETVDYDENDNTKDEQGGTLTAPKETGVTWLISYKQSDGKQVQAFNTSKNFVISSTSWLDVTINPKDISELAGDITKVGIDSFKHWSPTIEGGTTTLSLGEDGSVVTGIEYPFAGNNWKYEPGVTVQYQPFYYATSYEKQAGKTAYGGEKLLAEKTDYTISWMNNSSASTDENPARITLSGQGNYTGSLMLDFTITPARIRAQYSKTGAPPQYDKNTHPVSVEYVSAEEFSNYQNLNTQGVLKWGGTGSHTAPYAKEDIPTPPETVYSTQYRLRDRDAKGTTTSVTSGAWQSTIPSEAGVYDVKVTLGGNDYRFIKTKEDTNGLTPSTETDGTLRETEISNMVSGSHTILPAVVTYKYLNVENEIYNRDTHTPQLEFTNVTYDKCKAAALRNVVPVVGSDCTVTLAPKEGGVYSDSATDAGDYTVKVAMLSHNYCFDLTVITNDHGLIIGYNDKSSHAETDVFVTSTSDQTHTYKYTVRVGEDDVDAGKTEDAVGDFVIKKATITLDRFVDSTYNRGAQPQTPSFANKQRNNEAVPTLLGIINAGVTVSKDEFTVTYKDENVITPERTASLEGGLPFRAELYSVQIALTPAGKKNFQFATQTIKAPEFAHKENEKEGFDSSLLTQRLGKGEDDSVIIAPFLINRVNIDVTQLYSSDVYNAKDHFHATGTAGIAVENWVSAMFRYSSSAAIEANDLTVDVIFTKTTGDKASATVHYFPDGTDDTIQFDDTAAIKFAQYLTEYVEKENGFFTHAATYDVTVQFNEESFYITNTGATDNNLKLGFTYTITPAQISFSLNETSVTYDRQAHQPTIGNGIALTNSVSTDADVLPKLAASGDNIGIGEVWVAYGYDGWAGKTLDKSNGFKNAGSYTVTLTLHGEGGDFRFADNSYEVLRNYTIERRDISGFTPTYQDDAELKDHAISSAVGYHYTGSAIMPTITLSNESFAEGIELKPEKWSDETASYPQAFEVTFSNNVNAGRATVIMTGVNNFTGSIDTSETGTGYFYILPAIVNVTASDNSGHSETFEPDTSTFDKGSLTFSYNKTAQTVSFKFSNLCETLTLPNSSDYVIEYYKATDWDIVNNKPYADAKAIGSEGVTDSGTYYVWFQFNSGSKKFSNFVFYKENGEATSVEDMFDSEGTPHLYKYGFKVTVNPADIQIHLPDQFRNGKDFVNSFPYTATDYAAVLNSVTLSGENGVVPETKDYTVAFYTKGDKENVAKEARNAGYYYLAFLLTDSDNNYQVTGVYVGDGTTVSVTKVDNPDGDGYYANNETLKNITVRFLVETAKIEVYLSNQFLSDAKTFNNRFGFDRSDWQTRLNPVTFKNELRNGVIPGTVGVDYQVSFYKDSALTDSVVNAGSYTLKFTLAGDDAQNFVIYSVRAGKDGMQGTDYVVLTDGQYKPTGTIAVDMRAFDVDFTIAAANIEIHLSDLFVGTQDEAKVFINEFVYTRANRYPSLSVISITNDDRIVPGASDYEVTFKTNLEGGDTTNAITNVGKYYLIFKLKDDSVTNYNVTGIYAGDGTTVSVPTASGEDDKGYHGDKKSFSVKFDITPAPITVHIASEFSNGQEPAGFNNEFPYNKTDYATALRAISFAGETTPSSGDYTVTLNDASKAVETVINAGSDYSLAFALNGDAAKNYYIEKIDTAGANSYTLQEKDYTKTSEGNLTAFSVKFTVDKAQVNVYLADEFVTGETFNHAFAYDRKSWVNRLNSVTFKNVNGFATVPTVNTDYTLAFSPDEVVNAGSYQLKFTLSNKNFEIAKVFAQDGETVVDAEITDNDTLKFTVNFTVEKAQIEVYLSPSFLSGEAFDNSFGYDKTDRTYLLSAVQFKNVLRNGIFPESGEYSVTFKSVVEKTETDATEVKNVGTYKLVLELTANKDNFVIAAVYAGKPSNTVGGENHEAVALTEDAEKGYEITSGADKPFTAFSVKFSITPAQIQVHLSDMFRKGDEFFNTFTYNKSNYANILNSVTLSGTGGITPTNGEYSVTFEGDGTTNVGEYKLVFTLKDENNNYIITGVYAGNDEGFLIPTKAGSAYQETIGSYREGTLKEFKLAFSITAAQLDLYLNGFFDGSAFKNEFVYNNTDQSVTLGIVQFWQSENIIPIPSAYSVTFLFNIEDHYKDGAEATADEAVYDVGAYTLYFRFTTEAGGNYVINAIYAGKMNGASVPMTDGQYRNKTDTGFYVDFDITPSVIDVFFSAATLKNDGAYVNKFYYNRNDWTGSFGSIYLDAEGGGAVPQGAQYSVEYYKATSVSDTKEEWDRENPVKAIYDVGRYSVTFRLSKADTGHYPGVKHYNNFTIRNVYAGGTKADDSVPLQEIDLKKNPTGTNGYRKAVLDENNVYVTLVFDIIPNVVKLREVGNVVYNDGPQDASYAFVYAEEGKGAVLPDLSLGDFTATYSVNESEKTGNERFGADHKPYFAGAYTVSMELTHNFIFVKDGRAEGDTDHDATRNFRVTPVVLSPFLGFEKDGYVQKGENSLVYDGVAHEYKVYTDEVSVKLYDVQTEGTGGNVYAVREASYDGWAKDAWQNYTNAGTYTVTLKFFIFGEDGTPTADLGGNFCFGSDTYSISLTYAITPRNITDGDVFARDGVTLASATKEKVYTGRPQTDDFRVLIALTGGADKTELVRAKAETPGDYSISNTSDINVGHVDTMVTGMNNYQGTVNLSYDILPAEVKATIDSERLAYNAQDQFRSFAFENLSGTEIAPVYNSNEEISDYTITYTYFGKTVTAPHNAGTYTVTVTLKALSGANSSNFTFASEAGKYVDKATFTFEITKAQITLAVIPGASYTGDPRPAIIAFANAANPTVLPKDYTVTYDDSETVPTHVKTNGEDRTPVAYDVKVTLKDVSGEVTGTQRDLSNFKFVKAGGGSASYNVDANGTWGEENYVITPAVITGTISVWIDGKPAPDISSNVYNALKHNVSVAFRNAEAGFSITPEGTMGAAKIEGLKATYEVTNGDGLLYNFGVSFTPSWIGYASMPFDGVPENAGAYVISVDLVSADFSFATSVAHAEWTYTVANAQIENATLTAGENSTTFVQEYAFAPDAPISVSLTADDFGFVDNAEGFNAANATFSFTSCSGAGTYEALTNDDGLTIGYKLTGAGTYTIAVTVDAPNHNPWAITLKVTVKATTIKLQVLDAHYDAIYGETYAYNPDTVLETVLGFIREGKIRVIDGIAGTPEEQAETLVSYNFRIHILTDSESYSHASLLKAGDYGLEIDSMPISGFEGDSFIVFDNGTTKFDGNVLTVSPLAIVVETQPGLADMHYNGTSLVNDAANFVNIANIFAGDQVFFDSIRTNSSEGGNYVGSRFEKADAVHVGSYWVHVFTDALVGENGLGGSDSANYLIETKDLDSPTIRYNGTNGVYVFFEIHRRQVELAIANSTSVYGDSDAVYGENGAKKFNISFNDSVLTRDFGMGANEVKLHNFMLDLLALFEGEGSVPTKLNKETKPYPGAGTYTVKLDPDAGKRADGSIASWVLGGGMFNFDDDFVLHIDDGIQSGTHTVTKRDMRVNVHDFSTFYGEPLVESEFEGKAGSRGFTPLDTFVDGDDAKKLAITITRNPAAFTGSGLKPTAAGYWPAHYYEGGLTAVSKSANYEVKFSEGTGNYNIVARPITVLINRQESVFGEPRVTNLTGETAWEIYSELSETNKGYAKDEGRSTVAITLSIDDIINPNAAAGIYPNVIKGNCANPNYNVTFRNWVNEGSGNVPGEYEGGEYEITRRKVVVVIDKSEAIYGTEGIKEGMRITLTAPVYGATGDKPINAAQWSYDLDASAYKILPEHISYLTFYLGKATPETPDTRYAVVGKHPIVGVWGHGYDSDMIFMKSYDVQFAGSWEEGGSENENYHVAGVFTVNPADITRLDIGDWSTTQPYREVADKDDRSPDAGWYPMAIEPSYLVYAGDFTVASEGELIFNEGASTTDALVYDVKYAGEVVATITYGKPQNRLDGGSNGIENVENLWTVHSVGVWEMEVTVVADNHNEAKFIYTANVASVVASVYLNTLQDAYTFTYGDYAYADPGDANDSVRLARLKDFPLTDELHTYLAKSIIGVDGLDEAYPALSSQQRIDLILDNSWVEVVSPVISNAGKLAAGRYHIRIVAITGCGFTARFVEGTPDDGVVDFSGYDRLIVEEKELGINWINNKELGVLETRPTLTDVLTYTYSSYDYEFMPLFTNIVEKDKVDAPKPSYLQDDVACSGKPRNVGEYTIVVPSLLSGPDAKNYKLPEKLTMTLVIVPMKVTVTLFDRTMTYGEEMPGISAPVGNSETEITPSHAWTSDKIGAKDDASALGVKISYLDKDGKIVTRETGVGVYRIVGSVDGAHPNYDVTFRNADESGEEAKLTSFRAKLTVAIESRNPGSVYGDPKVAVNYRIESGSVASWQTESQLGITFQVGDGNAKNAGTYYILGDWTEKNYNIVFVGDWTEALPADYVQEAENGEPIPTSPQGAGTYVITRRVIRLKLPETMTSVYGDYSIDGDMTSIKFENYVLEHVECDTGSSYAPGEDVNSLKLSWTLPTVNDVGDYTIHAEEADDPNYEITFLNDLVWTVTERPVIITVHTQRSQYGDNLVTLVGSNKALWSAENLADWHHENAYDALLMVLDYDDTVITNRSNAGEYRGAIIATPTENLNNYTFTFKNDDGEVKGGTYVIEQREIRLDIQDCESVFGDIYEESDFNQRIQNSYKLASGSSLAPWDESDETFKLGVVLTKTGDYHAGIYPITGRDTDSNYAISFTPLKGFYTITRATNEWNKHFTLKSMNEGETPDEDLITATAKFGDVTITYYYDENLLFPVESTGTVNSTDLSTYPKSTYYAKVTVEGCADYTGLEEKVSFVVNESFLVINGGLDITLYVCIFASQFIILTCALIFLRPRKKKEEDAEAAK